MDVVGQDLLRGDAQDLARLHPFLQGKDRKSTRLNSSHTVISYAVFCLKKKNQRQDAGGRRARLLGKLGRDTSGLDQLAARGRAVRGKHGGEAVYGSAGDDLAGLRRVRR